MAGTPGLSNYPSGPQNADISCANLEDISCVNDTKKLRTGQERKRTDSRWKVLKARNSAAAAYTQVEAKMSAIEFQW